jgi:hypothetical protein
MALAVAALMWTAACGDDPPGPGVVEVVVSDTLALGGAVVELSGEGLLGVQTQPGVSIVFRSLPGSGGALPRLRVVAIREVPGPLRFTVDIARADAPLPEAVLIQASDRDDALLPGFLLPELQLRR